MSAPNDDFKLAPGFMVGPRRTMGGAILDANFGDADASDGAVLKGWFFGAGPATITVRFRKTLSGLGTRAGGRQLQSWG